MLTSHSSIQDSVAYGRRTGQQVQSGKHVCPPLTRFAICIPNYNYGRYLGITVNSVLSQDFNNFEICISDNASTDNSLSVVKSFDDSRITYRVNQSNVGFAGNLDRAVALSTSPIVLILSSDDVMLPGALVSYERLYEVIDAETSIVGSSIRVVDADGLAIGSVGSPPGIWDPAWHDRDLSDTVGADVYAAPAEEVLRRSIKRMRNPYHFLSTAYHRALHERVGGYGGQRLMNPDKWFHWRVLAEAKMAYFVDHDLFGYRWHSANQTAQQHASAALKFLLDEYMLTFQLPTIVLERLGLTRSVIVRSFLHEDIALRGLRDVARGEAREARRALHFADATYPAEARRDPTMFVLRLAAGSGSLGRFATNRALPSAIEKWRRNGEQPSHRLYRTWSP